jgi:8-oxo-dGTP pyrophosphatase MutT (NUDIX family)
MVPVTSVRAALIRAARIGMGRHGGHVGVDQGAGVADPEVSQDVKDLVADFPAAPYSAAVVVTDGAGRLVVVNPAYKDGWELPGGMAEEGEAPHESAAREVAEEIGLDLPIGRLLVCDVTPAAVYGRPVLHFVFDTRPLTDAEVRDLRAVDLELVGAAALPPDDALAALHPRVARRAAVALEMRGSGGTVYLVDGRPTAE